MTETPSQTIKMTGKLKDMCDERGQIIRNLKLENAKMEQQLTSLAEEIDELKKAFRCEKAFKEGSEKANSKLNEKINDYVKLYQQERKNIIDLEGQIQDRKSLLSKAKEENKELKENTTIFCYTPDCNLDNLGAYRCRYPEDALQGLPTMAIYEVKREAETIRDLSPVWFVKDDKYFPTAFPTKELAEEALASLNKSKGEEE